MKSKGKHPSNKLTALKVKRESNPGSYADGNGLYLKVDSSGAKRWVQRLVINGKRTDMGLGSATLVSITDARALALHNRSLARNGGDPLAEKRMKNEIPTFKKASYSVYDLNRPTWKNEKHAQQWINTLEKYVFPFFGGKKVNKVNSADLMKVLIPIWTNKPETARRVKQRIGMVLKWSIASNYRKDNPALDIAEGLPKLKMSDLVVNHKSLPYDEVAHAITTIQNTNALPITKLAFEFLVLNASRSGEVRGATWDEIQGEKGKYPKSE